MKRHVALAALALSLRAALAFGQPAPEAGPSPTPAPAAAPAAAAPATATSAPAEIAPTTPGPPEFTVGDIRVEGLQRVSEGTVYNYLPVNIGDRLTPQRVREAIRALYATGFFRDVQLRRDGNALVVVVLERPSIESFEITGNKDIKTEDLQKSLRGVGLATGKTFDRSVLEDVTQYLTDQYFARGKYGVRIDSKVEEETGNRVKIKVDIIEGSRAKIRQINIVGNTRYKPKQILDTLELKTPNWLSWYKQDDRYSRESLQGDLEKVRNFYMDRGYANFQLESTQVAITPEKEDIFITINVEEGQVYKLSGIKLAGTFVVPQAELERLVLVHKGEIFDRKLITQSQELMQNRMGRDGYFFSKVEPVPTADNANHTVALTFFVDPGNRVYVRNITFSGVNRIDDEVLRREMRQLEGGWLSNTALERSKQRIQRLPYVKSVEFETTPVAGTPDLIDVNYKIEEGPASQLSGGIGYSATYKLMLNGSFADADFLGTGERIAVQLNGGAFSKVYTVQWTNPYTNIDNLQRTLSVSYSDVTQFVSSSSNFSSQTLSVGPTWAYPISETMFLRAGFSFDSSQLLTNSLSSAEQAQQWVQQNGHPYSRLAHDDASNNDYVFYGSNFRALEVVTGWDWDTRNRTLFADRGMHQSVSLSVTTPGSDVKYWIGNYLFLRYLPLWKGFTLSFLEGIDYGAPLGNTTNIPPYRQFYGGGPDNVRGFRESLLGPRDQFGNPYGGNMRITSQNEIIFPMPGKWAQTARVSAFFDMGGVYETGTKLQFFGPDNITPESYRFRFADIKKAFGVSVTWLAPIGLFRFSLGVPLNARHGDGITNWGDETEAFQFSVGQAF
ncbi:MAG TPA: outer membrane protein assembly factor BamA [Steroidobacteraceae bacterium]|nr:outer membrane protein assembly factor BamA [Steroidobacteraceae bacterium]